MIIEIKNGIFEDKSEIGKLKFLIQLCFYQNRYKVYADYTLILDSPNFKNLDEIDQELLTQSFNETIQEGTYNDVQIVITNNSDNENFSIDEAIKFLIQPVSIILENSLNDSYFINATIKHFDSSSEINRHFRNNWIQFDNAGGATNIRNLIAGKLKSYNSWPKKNKNKYLRCFVIFDSDKTAPTKTLKDDKIICQNYLLQNDIIHHILEKREMENYLPDDVISSIANPYLNQYLKLTPIQKDHFDIQNGFYKKKRDKKTDPDILELYESLSDQEWAILKDGLNIAPYDKNFKSEFPKLFSSKLINRKNLEDRLTTNKRPNEFELIINKTLSLL